MKKIKLSRLYWMMVVVLCAYGSKGISLCSRISKDLGAVEFETLCDLEFCTCHDPFGKVKCICPVEEEEFIVRSKGSCSLPPPTSSFLLENCKNVTVIEEAFHHVKDLRNIEFRNIKKIILLGRIFPQDGPPRDITFINSSIPDVPSFTFSGNINSVTFDNCYVKNIRAFAFSSIHGADRIIFRDTHVINVEAQSFKKFTTNKFLIIGSHFDVIPSRFVVDLIVDILFKIDSSIINEIRTLGFKIYDPKKVLILNSVIDKLHGEAFKIVSKGEVVITNNQLKTIDNEAFRGITADKNSILRNGKQKFKFLNQTITNLEDKSLYINRTDFDVYVARVMIDETCTCDGLMLWTEMITVGKKPIEMIEVELEPIWCRMDDKKEGKFDFVPGRDFYKNHCTNLTTSIYFFVIIITATTVGLIFAILIIVCIIKQRKKWKPVPISRREVRENGHKKVKVEKKTKKRLEKREVKPGTTKAMIVPDGRTYKETEFHIIVEKAEPLHEDCVSYAVVRDRSRSQMN